MAKNRDDLELDAPAAAPVPAGREDRSKAGWPCEAALPYVEPEYYKIFPAKLRPVVQPGGPASFNLSLHDQARVREIYQRPFPLQTYVNMGFKPHFMSVVGSTPGSLVDVEIVPFGVLRGDPTQISKIAMSGSPYPTFWPIGPEGDCKGELKFKDQDGREHETCWFTNCPRHGHPNVVHTVQHALHFIQSIGDGLRSPINPQMVDGEPPDEEASQRVIMDFQKIDPRPAVSLFGTRRVQYLMERRARREAMRNNQLQQIGTEPSQR